MPSPAQRYVQACEAGNVALRIRLLDELLASEQDSMSLRATALWYVRHGVAVFPVEPGGKRPLTQHGFKNASTRELDVVGWWGAWPDANIGAPTGITFDVVDVDGPEGVDSLYFSDDPLLKKLPAEIGHSLTGDMPGHHIFIPPTGRGNKASMLPGVDYRGKGGYVVLPPSITKRRYVWTKPLEIAS